MKMNFNRQLTFFAAISLFCGFFTPYAWGNTNLQTQSQCNHVISAIAEDIVGLKTNFTELANFSPTNAVIFGNVLPKVNQLHGHSITYYYNYEYINGLNKTQNRYQLRPGGCILKVQLFPDGGSWAGFVSDKNTRNVNLLSPKSGIRLQATINTQNTTLADRLETILIERFKALE